MALKLFIFLMSYPRKTSKSAFISWLNYGTGMGDQHYPVLCCDQCVDLVINLSPATVCTVYVYRIVILHLSNWLSQGILSDFDKNDLCDPHQNKDC